MISITPPRSISNSITNQLWIRFRSETMITLNLFGLKWIDLPKWHKRLARISKLKENNF